MKNLNTWIENNIWLFSAIVAVVASPVIAWLEWGETSAIESTPIRVLLVLGSVLVVFVGLGLLLMFNRWSQRKHREKGRIE